MILADDLGQWALGCYGNPEIKTPNIDKLASKGMIFNNFFCVSPVCSPARASIFTGQIPSSHGVHDWIRSGNIDYDSLSPKHKKELRFKDEKHSIQYLKGQNTFTQVLKNNGYTCGLSGKWHLGDSCEPQAGFDFWSTIARGGCGYYDADVVENGTVKLINSYITDYITEKAIHFIDNQVYSEGAFYLSVHYTAPHSPWSSEHHPPEYLDLYSACDFEEVPNLPIHPWQNDSCPVGIGEVRKENLQGYYASITAMDDGIGRLLEQLEKKGLSDNTIIFFTSDNGMNMGHHGIWGKGNGTYPQNMYDTSVKVPFILNGYGVENKGQLNQSLLSHYDILPTILELVDISSEELSRLPGRSFRQILKQNGQFLKDHVVVYDEYGDVRMIRNERYKYVYRYPDGPDEFFDLHEDPNEDNNCIDDEAYINTITDMKEEMTKWFDKYTNQKKSGLNRLVKGKGQLDKYKFSQDLLMWHSREENND